MSRVWGRQVWHRFILPDGQEVPITTSWLIGAPDGRKPKLVSAKLIEREIPYSLDWLHGKKSVVAEDVAVECRRLILWWHAPDGKVWRDGKEFYGPPPIPLEAGQWVLVAHCHEFNRYPAYKPQEYTTTIVVVSGPHVGNPPAELTGG